ncbi:Phytochrome-like protein cph2 [Fundidesulfovibrio magnetotacticus]|uniref:diguanylate cyclase n=1 Tax=Fundidesulfovibrio magnetotacticus TaxID=2730080 RepID=A0A6V8M111_9BACT|nr:GGDEF domain-containing protein [Fundidesulfovibrio magnetotacticus]GFK95919.1 Phytochrome-like protein cph2 [Fundidesulfovibrio magnetotacticus]
MTPSPTAPRRASLTRHDLVASEHVLRDALRDFVAFKSSSLYFPPPGAGQDTEPAWLKGEQKLLLPLSQGGAPLGVFMAKGVRGLQARTLPLLAQAARLCLENLALAKALDTDPVTGLGNRQCLLDALEREIGLVQASILPGQASWQEAPAEARGGFGLVLFDVDYFSWVNQNYGHLYGETTLARLGALLAAKAPEGAALARLEEDLFAVLLPGASAARCLDLAESVRAAAAEEVFDYAVTGERIRLTLSAGFALYPRDLHGGQLAAPAGEAARVLVQKARKTLSAAKDLGRDQVMSFGKLLREGGQILERLPLGRLAVSLGRAADAKEGMRFLVWSPRFEGARQLARDGGHRVLGRYPAMVKGEIILMEAQEDVSYAEVLHLTDASWTLEPGDRLLLAQDPEDSFPGREDPAEPPRRDMASGLLGHRDFIRRFTQAREGEQAFTLALVRLPDPGQDRGASGGSRAEASIQELAALCRDHFGQELLGGRFSTGSLILYVPGQAPAALRERFQALAELARERLGLALSMGLAGHPFLSYGKADVLENCRKALDHAQLIQDGPRLALFDSISLTISADRLFTLGDLYGAVEEYRLALLADEGNVLARNSLGICLGRLGRMAQARAEFERVLALEPRNQMALYNLGHACQRLGEEKTARKAFQRCLKLNPQDVYSLLRLGRMAEDAGKPANARGYYQKALALPGGPRLVTRHLARLAQAQGRADEAREHLQQALLQDPKDAFSLNLLARIYLDAGEDPAIAEALARQSAALRPDQGQFWKDLARALEAQGKTEEARQALGRAG